MSWKKLVVGVALLGVGVLIGAVYALSSQYLRNRPTIESTVTCTKHGVDHVVVIQNAQLSTTSITARACDTLTITNDDDKLRLIAFGRHDHHINYDGITEELLSNGQSMTVTLNELGTFLFHDHLDDTIRGEFTVQK